MRDSPFLLNVLLSGGRKRSTNYERSVSLVSNGEDNAMSLVDADGVTQRCMNCHVGMGGAVGWGTRSWQD